MKTSKVILSVVLLATVSASEPRKRHLEYQVGETVVVREKGGENLVMIVATERGSVATFIRSGEKPRAEMLTDTVRTMTSVFFKAKDGTLWEVIDGDGDGVPEVRTAKDGPMKGKTEKLAEWKWEEVKRAAK
jgi:hypothetical protein